MAIQERSLGPLYFATVHLEQTAPVHRVGIVQMERPWRRGRAILFPWRLRALVIGLWFRSIEQDIEDDFDDQQWFDPKWLANTPEDISLWRTYGAQKEEAETGA